MNTAARKLLKDAMKLPTKTRAAIAGSLLRSLDGESEEDVEAAWAAEIKRRLDEFDSGKVKAIPWSEVRRSLRSRHRGRT